MVKVGENMKKYGFPKNHINYKDLFSFEKGSLFCGIMRVADGMPGLAFQNIEFPSGVDFII